MNINWEAVTIATLTAIRMTWPVTKLQRMAAQGHDTPASGDTLKRALARKKDMS